jgi:hypothetical protein
LLIRFVEGVISFAGGWVGQTALSHGSFNAKILGQVAGR